MEKNEKILKNKIKSYTKDMIDILSILGLKDIKDCGGLRYNEIRIAANGLNISREYQFYLRVSIRHLDNNTYSLFLLDYNCDLDDINVVYQFLSIFNILLCFENISIFDIATTQPCLSLLINNPIINSYLCNIGFIYCENGEFPSIYSKKFL